ncbi:DUF2798 domain-containing protein [Neisseriaceae bacterium B1]
MARGFINKKYVNVVFSFYMASMMGLLMSSVLVAINVGIDEHFLMRVLKSYMVALPVAFMCTMITRPIAVYLTNKTIDS